MNSDILDIWQDQLEAAVLAEGAQGDGSHDLGHCRRVWLVSQQIAGELDGSEPANRLVLLAGAYLHDIVIFEKSDPRRSQASQLAAVKARSLLEQMSFPPELLDAVVHVIEAHSYSAGITPRTTEAKILQDADRMETLGAIGLARIFYVGGRIGAKLFHEEDPFARNRPLQDTVYSLDHFYTKILKLPDLMNTQPGRVLAHDRTRIIKQFLDCLFEETGISENGA